MKYCIGINSSYLVHTMCTLSLTVFQYFQLVTLHYRLLPWPLPPFFNVRRTKLDTNRSALGVSWCSFVTPETCTGRTYGASLDLGDTRCRGNSELGNLSSIGPNTTTSYLFWSGSSSQVELMSIMYVQGLTWYECPLVDCSFFFQNRSSFRVMPLQSASQTPLAPSVMAQWLGRAS